MGRGPGEGERRAPWARVPGRLRRRLSLLRVVRVGRLRPGRGDPTVLVGPGFVAALEERGIRAEPGGDVRLHGAVELLADILTGGR